MSKVAIKTETLKSALKVFKKKVAFEVGNTKSTAIPLSEENKDLLYFLEEHIPLTDSQKSKIGGFLFGGAQLVNVQVNSVNSFYNKLSFANEATEPVLEIKIGSKWYPIMVTVSKWKGISGSWMCELSVRGGLGAMEYERSHLFGDWNFEDKSGKIVNKSIDEALAKYNIRVASKESIEHSKQLAKKIPELWSQAGTVYDASGTGLTLGYFGWSEVNVGQKDSPSNVIIEPSLENQYQHHDIHSSADVWQLPFVRVFSLKHKAYVFTDIEGLQAHEYHRDGKSKIVLPPKMLMALESIFNAEGDNIFGDLFHGRHGGIVVLANGPSGVGKTLTAEVFAEYQQRPLYPMEISEVGTSVKEVEQNLQRIFARAKKWNAVLLFDEADIFLSERSASELERSAIVGIFLRLLDYYEGTFFLTTNRGGEIDKAFKGRVTLYLNYPELTPETRHTIWINMLKSANLNAMVDPNVWYKIIETPLNGRQIRNQVRLLKLMYPTGELSAEDILNSLEFVAI